MVPNYQHFFTPVLKAYSDGTPKKKVDIIKFIEQHFQFTQDDLLEKIASGADPKISDRTQWSIYYLFRAGFLSREARGQYKITEIGLLWLQKFKDQTINNNILSILSTEFQSYLYGSVIYQTLSLDKLTPPFTRINPFKY